MDNIKNPIRRYGDYLNCKPDADALLLELEQIKQTVETLAEEGMDKNIAGITLRVDYGTGMIWWEIDVIPEDDKEKEKRMPTKPLSEDAERYLISDARIMFDTEKLKRRTAMREILFRAKTINNPKWVEGYYSKTFLYGAKGREEHIPVISDDNYYWYKINSETLCEFTGLTDSKGVKVFEGDILSFTCWGEKWRGYITFGNPHGRYSWGWEIVEITPSEMNTDILLWFDMEEGGAYSEVIGNIYDNPKLLKEGEKQ